jgi:hypothetical protein
MDLRRQQLETILARVLPGERLKEFRPHAGGRFTLELVGGERVTLLTFATPAAAESAQGALDMLRGEVDLAVPYIRGADTNGDAAAVSCLVTSELAGEPLADVLPRLGEGQLYALGQRLGEAAYRVHRIRCPRYGTLAAAGDAANDERGYVFKRLDADLGAAYAARLVSDAEAATVRGWFETALAPVTDQAALVCGGLRPDAILVRPSGAKWELTGLAAWDEALGWVPAWDHALLFDAASDSRLFSLRVGYGNAYDMATTRAYEQTREHALRPYRALLSLRRAIEHFERSERGAAQRRKAVALSLAGVKGE